MGGSPAGGTLLKETLRQQNVRYQDYTCYNNNDAQPKRLFVHSGLLPTINNYNKGILINAEEGCQLWKLRIFYVNLCRTIALFGRLLCYTAEFAEVRQN
jgi:hypothetical protein